MTPTVSVIMPVNDSEHYIRKSIESILNQTYRDFEFIIVSEYGTNSETVRIVESYSDERIRHIRNHTRLGFVPSLNVGLKEAQGEYIARMDADDVSKPERFETQVDYLNKHPDVGVLGTAIEIIDDAGKLIAKNQPPTVPGLMKWSLLFDDEIAHSSVMVRHSLFDLYGLYKSELPYGEDYELWLRLVERTNIVNLPQTLHQRRLHGNQLTGVYKQMPAAESVRVHHQVITATLGREIQLKIVLALAKSSIGEADDAFQAALTLRELYYTFLKQNALTRDQRELIRHDTARRMVTLSRISARKNPFVSGRILLTMSRFCPSEVPFSIAEVFRRAGTHFWSRSFN